MCPLINAKWAFCLPRETLLDHGICAQQSPKVRQGDIDCLDKLCTENLKCTKGQIILKCLFGVFNSSKKRT